MKATYKFTRYTCSPDDWPPNQPKHFTSVALIHHKDRSSEQEVIGVATATSQGITLDASKDHCISNYMQTRTITKDISEIFKPFEAVSKTTKVVVLIEGAPGIGKTVLSKEIAYQWATEQFFLHKLLVFLLYLRDPTVQKLSSLFHLVDYFCKNMETSKVLTQHLYETQGVDLVLVLDGYDEINEDVRKYSLIADIIGHKILPKCYLIITSRPAAATQLHGNVTCRVEVLGFTNSDRQDFIKESLKDSPEKIQQLQDYLDKNLVISTLCYTPLIMTILLCLFQDSETEELPNTQTELYEKFIIHTIVHYFKKGGSSVSICSLLDLKNPHKKVIKRLAELSYKLLSNSMIVFTADDVKLMCPKLDIGSKNCIELGLLKETKYINMKKSYNFLHLSIQEYLAAIHVSSLSFLQQKEILQKTFWVDRYFNMWIMYMGITEGKSSAFKYLLSNGIRKLIYNQFSKHFHISEHILNNKVSHLYLFQCFLEAKNDDMCTLINSFFKNFIIDLSAQTLTQSNVNVLCFYLLRSSNNQWNELNLSGCSIGDSGCDVMHKFLIVGDKPSNICFRVLNLSNNQITYQSTNALVNFVHSFKTTKFNISDNPLHVSIFESLCQCEFLKVLIAGSSEFSHNIDIRELLKTVDASMLHYLEIRDNKKSCLMIQKSDLNIEHFPLAYLSTYHCFTMKNCKITDSTLEKLVSFLTVQETLEYCYIMNNDFTNSSVSSYCATLMKQSSLQEIVIFEHSLVTSITDQLSNILNCRIIVYSKSEIKSINASTDQILAALAEQPTITKLDIVNCTHQGTDITHCLKITNIIKCLMFTKVKASTLFHLVSSIINYTSLKILHFNEVDITDEAIDELLITLCENRSLVEFSLIESHISPMSTNKIMKILKNIYTVKSFKMCNCDITDEIADNLKAVFEHNSTTLVNLDISHNIVEKDAAIKIIKALKDCCNLKVYRINGNNITNEAVTYITEVLLKNIYLVEIDVTSNMLSPFTGKDFISALKDNISLQVCNIGDCMITEKSTAKIAAIISKSRDLKELDLSNSHLTTAGALSIVQALQSVNCLQVFKVGKHLINETTVNDMTTILSNNPDLVHLDLSFSLLTSGAIKLIRSLQNRPLLKVLKLSNCKIAHTAAEELACVIKTTSLVELDVSHNSLLAIGIILISRALKDLKSLQILNISNCDITNKAVDYLMSALLTLNGLRELDMSLNKGITASEISQLLIALQNTNICTLKINFCGFYLGRGHLNKIGNSIMTKMNCLELCNNRLDVHELLENTTTLRILNISRCYWKIDDNVTENLSRRILQNQHLTELNVSHNSLAVMASIQLAKALQSIETLQTLFMNNCEITDDAAEDIATVISHNLFLKELNVSWNRLTGIGTTKIFNSLKDIRYLRILKVASCGITIRDFHETLTANSFMFHLQELDASHNEIIADDITILPYLISFSSMQILKIVNCSITDKDVDTLSSILSNTYALTHLEIHRNKFSAEGISKLLTSLGMLSGIRTLKLSDCSIEDTTSCKFAGAIKSNFRLTHLELCHGYFMDGVDVFFASLESINILQVLILVDCNITTWITDKVAAVISSNRTIVQLDLSYNPLAEGVVPIINALIGNKIIEILNLNSCEIRDEARTDLASLARTTALIELDVLNNELTDHGALYIVKSFIDTTSLKILRIRPLNSLRGYLEDTNDNIAEILNNKGILVVSV